MSSRGKYPEIRTTSYDWDPNLRPIDDADVEEYRLITFEIDYPAATGHRPWSELKESEKEYWRKRYKHGS